MLAYAITAARDLTIRTHRRSTEDEEIATIARKWGAETPFVRPANLANDYTQRYR